MALGSRVILESLGRQETECEPSDLHGNPVPESTENR